MNDCVELKMITFLWKVVCIINMHLILSIFYSTCIVRVMMYKIQDVCRFDYFLMAVEEN